MQVNAQAFLWQQVGAKSEGKCERKRKVQFSKSNTNYQYSQKWDTG